VSTNDQKLSKFLSFVLRHRPDEIGLTLDPNGWALVADLIERSQSASVHLTIDRIRELVRTSDKQRFALSDDGTKIRANQGHSVDVDLALEPRRPPEFLFHGTATRFLDAIRQEGLKPMGRQHVHLSPDEATATKVGQRHGKPAVLLVRSGEMHKAGRTFFLSANGVWLTDGVETEFLNFPE
jgi:putative RNA 2'-phosphotransferase